MDANLPDIGGIQAMKILREDPVIAHIPIVALSANAMPRDIRKGLEAGFFRYLTKPIKVNESWTRCAWRWNLPNSGPQKKGVHLQTYDEEDLREGEVSDRKFLP